MRHCGLRAMRGLGLFSGPVMSHDFVEAAYMTRAGYEVWLEPGLTGSYEESPPSLDDELARDRRWAKGNLQHLRLLFGGRGLHLAHRLAFLNGILSYAASPLWLAFLALSTVEVARFTLWPINYFPSNHSLFPVWPQWHPDWAIILAFSTAVILLLPKLLALIDAGMRSACCRGYGGFVRVLGGVVLETVASALLAPVRMLAHSRYVGGALFAIQVHWAGQNRSEELAWGPTLLKHLPATLLALAWAAFGYSLKPMFFYWSLPVVIPLLLAAPTSVVLSRFSLGDRLRRAGLWVIPQELRGDPLLAGLHQPALLEPSQIGLGDFEMTVLHPCRNALARQLARIERGPRATRIGELRERCLQQGPQALTRDERSLLADSRNALAWLHRQAWLAMPGTPWGVRTEALTLAICASRNTDV